MKESCLCPCCTARRERMTNYLRVRRAAGKMKQIDAKRSFNQRLRRQRLRYLQRFGEDKPLEFFAQQLALGVNVFGKRKQGPRIKKEFDELKVGVERLRQMMNEYKKALFSNAEFLKENFAI